MYPFLHKLNKYNQGQLCQFRKKEKKIADRVSSNPSRHLLLTPPPTAIVHLLPLPVMTTLIWTAAMATKHVGDADPSTVGGREEREMNETTERERSRRETLKKRRTNRDANAIEGEGEG